MSRLMNASAIGLRQMLPAHTKITRVTTLMSLRLTDHGPEEPSGSG